MSRRILSLLGNPSSQAGYQSLDQGNAANTSELQSPTSPEYPLSSAVGGGDTAFVPLMGTEPIDSIQHRHSLLQRRKRFKWCCFGLLIVLLVSILTVTIVLILEARDADERRHSPKRNVILMISDGYGPGAVTLTRQYVQATQSDDPLLPVITLPLDSLLIGMSRTRSSSSLVTDSAAGATAFSCGIKTHNGGIAVNAQQNPCATLLEAVKWQYQYKTGLVATSRITHATPAAFASHAMDRGSESLIAQHLLRNASSARTPSSQPLVDILFGGGHCFFQPKSSGGCRTDDLDLLQQAQQRGYKLLTSRDDLKSFQSSITQSLPVLGLFSEDHLSFDLDRNTNTDSEPSLKEMAEAALNLLSKSSREAETGFFLMIEGSRIDMAAHSNDAATLVREILAYQDTVSAVKSFVDRTPNTLMISISDHETGGVAAGAADNNYNWQPLVLQRVRQSIELLLSSYSSLPKNATDDRRSTFIRDQIYLKGLGISDATEEEIQNLLKAKSKLARQGVLATAVNSRAQVGFTSIGHTATDVPVYGYSSMEGDVLQSLRGNFENTQIGKFLSDLLQVDLSAWTQDLRSYYKNI